MQLKHIFFSIALSCLISPTFADDSLGIPECDQLFQKLQSCKNRFIKKGSTLKDFDEQINSIKEYIQIEVSGSEEGTKNAANLCLEMDKSMDMTCK